MAAAAPLTPSAAATKARQSPVAMTSKPNTVVARHPPFEPGNLAALKHGASSESVVRPVARNHRRRVLRQLRLRAGDLDPIGRGYLDLYCRTQAKVEAIDAFVSVRGLIRSDGEPQPCLRLYVSLVNSARLALSRLEQHVQTRVPDPVADVQAWLDALPEDDDATDGT